MKPLPELRPGARLLAGARVMIDVLADQLAQRGPEVRHRLTLTSLPALDTTDRDAFLGHATRLLHQLCESAAAQMRRPPQPTSGRHRRLDVIGAECQCTTPHRRLDLRLVARHPFALPPTHVRNDTGGGRASSPLPQTPTQRPTGARLF